MDNKKIRTTPKKHCYLCGSKGNQLYNGLKDRLFGVKGEWNINKCSNYECGLLWLNPMPITEDLPKLYETYYTHAHDPSPKKTNWLVQLFRNGCSEYLNKRYQYSYNGSLSSKLIAKIIKLNPKWSANLDFSVFYLSAVPNGKLLEIGCGSGDMLKNMQKLGWQVTGIDFDPNSVKAAQKKGLNVLLGDIEHQEFEENSFDAIVMSHVIEHLPDPVTTLNSCYKLLKPKGRLVSITPNTNGLNHNKYNSNSRILEPPRHLHLFNKNSLQTVTKQAGFNLGEAFHTVRDISGLWWASSQIQKHGKYKMERLSPVYKNLKLIMRTLFLSYTAKTNLLEGDEIVIISEK